MGTIYGLLCLDSHICRYVGYSANVDKRYKQHCRHSENTGTTKRQTWIRGLLNEGKKPDRAMRSPKGEAWWAHKGSNLGPLPCEPQSVDPSQPNQTIVKLQKCL